MFFHFYVNPLKWLLSLVVERRYCAASFAVENIVCAKTLQQKGIIISGSSNNK